MSIDRLPRRRQGPVQQVRFFGDPRLGRGTVWLGAVAVLVGFVMPFVRAGGARGSALEVAIDGAHNLWLTPGASILLLYILWSRRDQRRMRAARVAVFGLACAGALPLAYTCRRIALVAETQSTQIEWLWGLGVMIGGLLLAAIGSTGFGKAAGRAFA